MINTIKTQPVYRIAKKEYRTLPKAQVRLPEEKQDVEENKEKDTTVPARTGIQSTA